MSRANTANWICLGLLALPIYGQPASSSSTSSFARTRHSYRAQATSRAPGAGLLG
jgi:hypothetical protein